MALRNFGNLHNITMLRFFSIPATNSTDQTLTHHSLTHTYGSSHLPLYLSQTPDRLFLSPAKTISSLV